MKPDLRVTIAGVEFANPVMTASGCCGYGEELARLYPLCRLGALVTKSITRAPRLGHKPPRTAETASGMLNAIGLANVGIDRFIAEKIPFLQQQDTRIIVNVAGSTLEEYVEVCARLADVPRVDMIELNISCPNVSEGGIEIGSNPRLTEQTVTAVKRVFPRPLVVKLSPNVTSIVPLAQAAAQGGADALSLINSLIGTAVDIETWRPRLTNNRGGLTGPAIKPVALAMVDAVYNACPLPIIAIGGIATAADAVEFILCGAVAVQVGTALFVQPDTPLRIVDDLSSYLERKSLSSIDELRGKVRKY
ncbi:MAG TPA: dihydroorotate dehydrogenase [candidate division Zixibacteria bacterium]|nr:dihydroorotate dehydrogenase [candidate division Zixibacteria bacterium]MDM7973167.1 dihydroorotate dehydrogenase [candidate division Zixibacteria bacterium]HOD65847.1 dihydroorotate dehydrogenase [candidate division Zixibacteria bacterium]HOZ07463.1 dihydroorotate dehydrogenase [candidate division Zixibacteria bacterium]HPC10564.1 dihydroorotate dehydrogenase [candidate division Zixibacteria bacterium]